MAENEERKSKWELMWPFAPNYPVSRPIDSSPASAPSGRGDQWWNDDNWNTPVPVPEGSPIAAPSRRVDYTPGAMPEAPRVVPSLPEPRPIPEPAPTVPVLPEPARFAGEGVAAPTRGDQWMRDPLFKTTMPTTFGAAPNAAQTITATAPGAIAAMYGKNLKRMEEAGQEAEEAHAERQDLTSQSLEDRVKASKSAMSALADYREGLRKAQGEPGAPGAPPKAPDLQKMPARPDVKIRPWLDPEGKDTLTVIAQTLGMLAVGVGGVVHKAPLTAMKYFREAAELWRRDEVDAANSKMKQFEMEVASIKENNDLVLKQYEIADKKYATNLEAKKAAVIASLDGLKLHDDALTAASVPLDQAIAAANAKSKNASDILTHLEKYGKIVADANKAAGDIPTSLFKLVGEYEGLQARLKTVTDPAERAAIERRINVLEQTRDHYVGIQNQQMQNRQLAVHHAREYGTLNLRKGQTGFFLGALTQLERDYITLEKAGLLPKDPATISGWVAYIKQNMPWKWTPEVAGAMRGIEAFYPEIVIGLGRTFFNDIGVRTKDAFGPLEGKAIPFSMAKHYIDQAAARIKHFEEFAGYRIAELEKRLRTQPDVIGEAPESYRLPGAVTEEEDAP